MTNRVLLGSRSNVFGFYVSKPGLDVLTCTDDQMMFSSLRHTNQLAQKGSVLMTGTSGEARYVDISIISLGYYPYIDLLPRGYAPGSAYPQFGFKYITTNTIRLFAGNLYFASAWNSFYIDYYIFGVTING